MMLIEIYSRKTTMNNHNEVILSTNISSGRIVALFSMFTFFFITKHILKINQIKEEEEEEEKKKYYSKNTYLLFSSVLASILPIDRR